MAKRASRTVPVVNSHQPRRGLRFFPVTLRFANFLAPSVLVLLASCGPKPAAPDTENVALVESVAIPRDRLVDAWSKRAQSAGTNLPASTVLSDLVDAEAAFLQAQRSGFLDRPDIKAAMRSYAVARFKEERHSKWLPQPEPTEQEVREAYAERRDRFVRPPAANIAILFLQTPRTATAAKRQESLQLLNRWRSETLAAKDPAKSFAELVATHSSDAGTRYRRGELGWLTSDQMAQWLPKEAVASAMALASGAISQPVEAPDGFYLLRALGQRPAQARPYDEAAPILRHQLREERRQASETRFREEIRGGLVIRTNLQLLQSLTLTNKPPSAPPALPKG